MKLYHRENYLCKIRKSIRTASELESVIDSLCTAQEDRLIQMRKGINHVNISTFMKEGKAF